MSEFQQKIYKNTAQLVKQLCPDQPVFLNNVAALRQSLSEFNENFDGEVFYAVKANREPWLLQELVAAGLTGFEVSSPIEAQLVQEATPGAKLSAMNPVKSLAHIRRFYREFGVKAFALDCEEELQKIVQVTEPDPKLTLFIRLDVSNEGAQLKLDRKYGADIGQAVRLLRLIVDQGYRSGLTFHIGSQNNEGGAFAKALKRCAKVMELAEFSNMPINIGGGFPIGEGLQKGILVKHFEAIRNAKSKYKMLQHVSFIAEPGRFLAAKAQSLLLRVDLRKSDHRLYLNDGAYGALFDAARLGWRYPMRVHFQRARSKPEPSQEFHLFGPTCDGFDRIPDPVQLPGNIHSGDWIEFGLMGAYASSLASHFNGFGHYERHFIEQDFCNSFQM